MLLFVCLTLLLVHVLVVCFVVFGLTFCRYKNDDWQSNETRNLKDFHSSFKEYKDPTSTGQNTKELTSQPTHLHLHHFFGHGSPSTISLSLGRGGLCFVGPRERPGDGCGLGLEDCGLSGVEGGLLSGSPSSSSDDV